MQASATDGVSSVGRVLTRREIRELERARQLDAPGSESPLAATLPVPLTGAPTGAADVIDARIVESRSTDARVASAPLPAASVVSGYSALLESLALPTPAAAPLATAASFFAAAPLTAEAEGEAVLPTRSPALSPASSDAVAPRRARRAAPAGAPAPEVATAALPTVRLSLGTAAAPAAFDDVFTASTAKSAPATTSTAPIPLVGIPAAVTASVPVQAQQATPPSSRRAARASASASVPTPRGVESAMRPAEAFAPASARTGDRSRRAAASITPYASSAPAASRSVAAPGRSLSRRIAAKATAFVAMGFVALMAVATSVPAEALLSSSDVQAAALAAQMPKSNTEPGQSVAASGADSITVLADDYDSATVAEAAAASGIRMEATFVNNPAGTIQWPFAVGVHVGDRFGYRDCAGCSSNHGGQDFNPGNGAEIQAIADGVVSLAEDGEGSLGVHMMIDHVIDGETVTSVYAHMQHGSMKFTKGDVIKAGQPIGKTGSTGMSTGPHLHFEIRLGGINGTKVDPLDWLYANTN